MLCRVVLAATLLAKPALARGWSEHWSATSNTATSITGDVTLRSNAIVFADGKSLPFKKLENVSFTDDLGKTVPATIYQITKPADPVLLRGNRICGGGATAIPVTYIAIWHTQPIMPGEGVGREFAAYSSPTPPGPSTNGACGTYLYDLVK
jgi:hypothetical protein